MDWVVLKFGGTSVARLARWRTIANRAKEVLAEGRRVWIVVSAVSQVTNALERALADAVSAPFSAADAPSSLYNLGGPTGGAAVNGAPAASVPSSPALMPRVTSGGSLPGASSDCDDDDHVVAQRLREYSWIATRHEELGTELGLTDKEMAPVRRLLGELRRLLEGVHLTKEASPRVRARVVAFGELMSSHLGRAFLQRELASGAGVAPPRVKRVDARSLLVAVSDDGAAAAATVLAEEHGRQAASRGADGGGGGGGGGGGAWDLDQEADGDASPHEPGIGLDVDLDAELRAADEAIARSSGAEPAAVDEQAEENPAGELSGRPSALNGILHSAAKASAVAAADSALYASPPGGGADPAPSAARSRGVAFGAGAPMGGGGPGAPGPMSERSDEDRFLRADVAPVIARSFCEDAAGGAAVVITQGFIASTADEGETCLLGRGGSDTSGGLFACMLRAARLEIWTDVHGMFSADPRQVSAARLLQRLSYREAQELAAMGAKVLHPRCLVPAAVANVPVEIRNTEDVHAPKEAVTRIEAAGASERPEVLAVTRREGIAMVTVSTVGMWGAVGFVAQVFNACARFGCSVDLIATSQYAVSLTFDHVPGGPEGPVFRRLLGVLRCSAHVETEYPCAVVSVVGRRLRGALPSLGPALSELSGVECHMVSEAAEDLNMSFVVSQGEGDGLLCRLHKRLLEATPGEAEQRVRSGSLGPSWTELRARMTSSPSALAAKPPASPPHQPLPPASAVADAIALGGAAITGEAPGVPELSPGEAATESTWFLRPEAAAALQEVVACTAGRCAFVYSAAVARDRAQALLAALRRPVEASGVSLRLLHALKANDCEPLVEALLAAGSGGIECVSGAEVEAALRLRAATIAADLASASALGSGPEDTGPMVQYTPNFASGSEMHQVATLAMREGGVSIVLDGPEAVAELAAACAEAGGDYAGLEVGIRVDIQPRDLWGDAAAPTHHAKVTTAGAGQKFGCPRDALEETAAAIRAAGWTLSGLHAHAGSGILLKPELWARTCDALVGAALEAGIGASLRWLDCGGGMGVVERPGQAPLDLLAVGKHLGRAVAEAKRALPDLREVRVEPGRYCVAPAGALVAQVTQVRAKRAAGGGRTVFVGVSTGMNSLVRPAMYGSHHEAFLLGEPATIAPKDEAGGAPGAVHVVGPICETGDVLCANARFVPGTAKAGQWIAVANAGAYGAVMGSRYNMRDPAPEAVLGLDGVIAFVARA
ncbi:hypothetical protein FNF28_06630 [Cafeteria roenbergensis]|uniref:Aspartate kinase n=1 Tax=Cafeteria roenbergensis TaxID=33653 RepID=A0A5A8CXN1_CAFRO|nr:hypothetical protein FNF28_06630 [Cafeteria roenbergensis]